MQVPFVDLARRHADERAEILACLDRVLAAGQLIGGPDVASFEAAAARYIGIGHVVAVNSGTDALMLALWSLGIGRGHEVITTPISFVATVAAIVHVGAKPVFVDVGDDQNLDPAELEAAITPATRAIIPVHWGGRIADMDRIGAIARARGIAVIEDAAQAMGAERGSRRAGQFGDIAAFSAHPLKPLAALGDGGYLALADADRARQIARHRSHGLVARDECETFGINSRLDALHAAVLELRLQRLDAQLARRREIARQYGDTIRTSAVRLPALAADEQPAWSFFNIRARRRDELRAFLTSRGIETLVYYGTALHLHPAAASLGYQRGDLPVAEQQCDAVVALPCHPHVTDDQIAYVAASVDAFYD